MRHLWWRPHVAVLMLWFFVVTVLSDMNLENWWKNILLLMIFWLDFFFFVIIEFDFALSTKTRITMLLYYIIKTYHPCHSQPNIVHMNFVSIHSILNHIYTNYNQSENQIKVFIRKIHFLIAYNVNQSINENISLYLFKFMTLFITVFPFSSTT